MLLNLKPIIRNAFKNKGITLLNIFGLTTGLVCSIFLISWVIHESTYDSCIKDKEKIYRVVIDGVINGKPTMSASCVSGIGPESKNLFPEVENITRLSDSYANSLIRTSDKTSFRANGYAADSTFFELFTFQALAGDLENALNVKNSIVIDKQLATNFFGDEPAIGKQLFIRDQMFTVSAVLSDIPSNSHLQFQFLVPTLNMPKWWHMNMWGADNAITYIKLNTVVGIHSISAKITDMVYGHSPFWKDFNIAFSLQNIKDIPFSGAMKWDYAQKSSKRNIYAHSGIAFLIMLIACINFTNLFISSALKRKKAIGIKITSGAHKISIIKEYLVEVFIYVFSSFIIAVVLLKLLHPYLNSLSGSVIEMDYFSIRFIAITFPLILTTAILAGFFPGVYLTRFKPVDILKNVVSPKGNRTNIQKVLVTVQFVIAIVLIFAVVVIYKQVDFLQSKDLGFKKENVLYTHTLGKLKQKTHQNSLRNELMRNPNITNVAYREGLPTVWNNGKPFSKKPDNKNLVGTEEIIVDENYFDLMDIAFIEGENVFKHAHDSLNYCIVNEEAVKRLNLDPPFIDKIVYNPDGNYIVKGVIENINTKALTQQVDPCVYRKGNWQTENGILLFKLRSEYSNAIDDIQAYWEKEVPDRPFEYWFLDQTYDKLYKSEMKAREVLSWFTFLALILTSLGLLAMTYFITENRTKEIGIRKVNGAKVSEILTMLNKDFIKWVAIAFVIACPIAYYAMNKWLENFAYKTILSWWIFALAGVLALGIALLTVSWQSWRAATRNPVEALRYE